MQIYRFSFLLLLFLLIFPPPFPPCLFKARDHYVSALHDAWGVLQIFPIIHLNRANFLYIESVTLHLPERAQFERGKKEKKEEKWPRLLLNTHSFVPNQTFTFHEANDHAIRVRIFYREREGNNRGDFMIWLLHYAFPPDGLDGEVIAGKAWWYSI